MRLSTIAFCMILTTIFLSACAKQDMAGVEDRGGNFYSRNGVLSLTTPSVTRIETASYSAAKSEPVKQAESAPQQMAQQVMRTSAAWQWPVKGPVTETFGEKSGGVVNEGIVISAADGTPIKAAQAGEVAFVGRDTKTYGNIVILRHVGGDMTSYAHAHSIIVAKGERVNAGETIGYVGQSGSAKSPQLHFAVREHGMSIDPLSKLPQNVAMH